MWGDDAWSEEDTWHHCALAARLRELMRGSTVGRTRWADYCRAIGYETDPVTHPAESLEGFFAELESEGWTLPPLPYHEAAFAPAPHWGGKGGKASYQSSPYLPGGKGKGKDSKGKGKAKQDVTQLEVTEKLFVGGIPSTATQEEVVGFFSMFGEIAAADIKAFPSGELRGFAFITFTSLEAAQGVIDNYELNEIQGKWIDCLPVTGDKGKGKGKPSHEDTSGDWTCPDCGFVVFASKSFCPKCQEAAKGGCQLACFGGKKGGYKGKERQESDTIFVKFLPPHATEESIATHFSQFGEVQEVRLKLERDGTFRGFAFVKYSSVREASDTLGGSMMEGSWLSCQFAFDSEKNMAAGKGKGKGKREWGPEDVTNKIFIGGLPEDTKEPDVRGWCEQFGRTKEVALKYDSDNKFRGFAFISYETVEAAQALLYNPNGFVIKGVNVQCRPATDDGKGAPTRASQRVYNPDAPTPITTNVIRVRGMPTEKKGRDVFKLFFQFSTTRIRDAGGDDCFIEFTSKAEAENAYRAKRGATLNNLRIHLEGATADDFQGALAGTLAQSAKPAQDSGKGGGGGQGAPAAAPGPLTEWWSQLVEGQSIPPQTQETSSWPAWAASIPKGNGKGANAL